MRWFTTAALIAGAALFAWLVSRTDLSAVLQSVLQLGWPGAGAVVAVFAGGFAAEIAAWALLFRQRMLSARRLGRLWLVNMVGEAFNVILPFGSLGGEPFKALLLKRHYQVPYPDSSSALLLMQALLALAEAPFALIGVVLALQLAVLSRGLETALITATAFLIVLMGLMLAALHQRWLAAFVRRLRSSRWRERLGHVTEGLDEIERRMFTFMRRNPLAFATSLGLFFANWLAGAIEVWVILWLMEIPLRFSECWIIETAVVLVRSATFFIPANVGSFEAATVFVAAPLTGSTESALALALIRRARELSWALLGLAVAGWFNARQPAPVSLTVQGNR